MILVIIYFSSLVVPIAGGSGGTHRNILLDGLVRWDGGIYLSIAAGGYPLASHGGVAPATAFFPAYPLLVRAVEFVVHNDHLAGVLVSNVAFLVALAYLYALARRESDRDTAARAVFYLAAAPAAVFFSAAYTESLFVACVAATFYHAGKGQWAPAALAAILASATRNTGFVLAAVIALEALHQAGVRFWPRSSRRGAASERPIGPRGP